jgi:hypothetical protein
LPFHSSLGRMQLQRHPCTVLTSARRLYLEVDIGKFNIGIGSYKTAVVTDYVFLPGKGFPDDVMKNDMVCQMLEGEVRVKQSGNPGRPDSEFVAKTGHVFTCADKSHESDTNEGSGMAVMRVIDLLTT